MKRVKGAWSVGLFTVLACGGEKTDPSVSKVDTNETTPKDSAEESKSDSGESGEEVPDPAAESVEKITQAATALLDSLSETDRGRAQFAFDDPARKTWSNLPLAMYAREGILTGELSVEQRELAYGLLEASLSSQGYTQAVNIIDVDEWHRQNNNDVNMGEDLYAISIFGEPSTTEAWSWQLDGHHLCFTFTVNVDKVTMSPSLWGVNPLTIPYGNLEGLRAMGDEVDAGFAFFNTLSEGQKQIAVLDDTRTPGLLAGPGKDDFTIPAGVLGLSAKELSEAQKTLLLGLVQTYILDMEDTHAALRMAEIEAGVDDLHFAWMGPSSFGSEIYFRIYGPTVLIELDHAGGNNHIHSVYRNPENDYGEGILAAHYARYPHDH